MQEDLWNYWVKKLLFPKKFIIDSPGMLLSKTYLEYGNNNKRRMIYYFEDEIANLQIQTSQKIGETASKKLWYKIGKEIGKQFSYSVKIVNKSPEKQNELINHIFQNLSSIGLSAANKIKYNCNKQTLVLTGKENIVCRKTNSPELILGIVNGIMSSVLNKTTRIKAYCKKCPRHCKLFINVASDVNSNNINLKKYNYTNVIKHNKDKESLSFANLIKFNKINFSNKISFLEQTITLSTLDFFDIIISNYSNIEELSLLQNSLLKTSYKKIKCFLKNIQDTKVKINFVINMLTAFGWGKITYKKEQENIIFIFNNIPSIYDKSLNVKEYFYLESILIGYMNFIFQKSYQRKRIKKLYNSDYYSLIIELSPILKNK